jgi:hypothetical protein
MSKLSEIYNNRIEENPPDSTIVYLLANYGNHIFDSSPSGIADVIAGARWLRGARLPGCIADLGAGEGAAALVLARLLPGRNILAVELVEERARRIAAAAAGFGLANVTATAGDAFAQDLGGAAGLYLNSPFFTREIPALLGKLTAECRPGLRLFGVGAIVRDLRAAPCLVEREISCPAYNRAGFELV